jgi:hypothetical protein
MKRISTIIILLITILGLAVQLKSQSVSNTASQSAHKIYLYPNPVSANVLKIVGDDIQSIEIINIIGQKIKNWEINRMSERETLLKFNNIDKGLYIIKCTFSDKEQVIKKFLIK